MPKYAAMSDEDPAAYLHRLLSIKDLGQFQHGFVKLEAQALGAPAGDTSKVGQLLHIIGQRESVSTQ